MFRNPFNWYNKFGTIPSSYREAMSYEEQILWLCQQITELKEGSANYNYDLLENKPSINGVTLQGNVTASQLGIDFNYNYLTNKPSINNVLLQGNKTLSDLGIQGKLTAGSGISIVGNTISATGGGTGGTSDYEDLNNKPSINDVVLLGNSDSKTLGLQNTLWTDETSNIVSDKIVDIASYQIGDVTPTIIPELAQENGGYAIIDVFNGSYIDIYGNYDFYLIDENNVLRIVYSSENQMKPGHFSSTTNGIAVVNFFSLNEYTPQLKLDYSGEDITGYLNRLKSDYNTLKNDLVRFESSNYQFENVTISQNGFFNVNKSLIGATLPEVTLLPDYKYVKIDLAQKKPSSDFIINGKAEYTVLWFTTATDGLSGEKIIKCSDANLNYDQDSFITIDITNADYVYFQFSNVQEAVPKVELLSLTELGGNQATVNHISTNVILSGTPSLTTGFYVIDNGGIYIGNAQASNLAYGVGEIVYYDSTLLTFYGSYKSVYYESNLWNIIENAMLENSLTNSRNKIPTSQAVYNAISDSVNFYTPINGGVYTLNMNGTISSVDTSITLEAGKYYKLNGTVIQYYQNNELKQATFFNNSLIYCGASGNNIGYLKAVIFPSVIQLTYEVTYIRDTIGWNASGYEDNNIVQNNTGSYCYVATSIPSANISNNDVPTISAIKNYSDTEYSTTEKRIGTWIDGKPLYQRTFTGSLPEYEGTSIDTLISIPNFSKLCEIKGYYESYYGTSSGNLTPIGAGTGLLGLIKNSQLCLRQTANTSSEADYYVTVTYTKTTD